MERWIPTNTSNGKQAAVNLGSWRTRQRKTKGNPAKEEGSTTENMRVNTALLCLLGLLLKYVAPETLELIVQHRITSEKCLSWAERRRKKSR